MNQGIKMLVSRSFDLHPNLLPVAVFVALFEDAGVAGFKFWQKMLKLAKRGVCWDVKPIAIATSEDESRESQESFTQNM